MDHVGFQCDDLAASRRFYDTVLEPLGYAVMMDHGVAVGYGDGTHPRFWLSAREDVGTGLPAHIAFQAASRELVDRFHELAVGLGAESLHAPRLWPEYHPDYYGAFVRDPDGHNVEAVHHTSPPTT
jgi:catechol 2,3-dioxygenase-like lactoylglutathione lyase family enzyme